jgi:hypothetical protein
MVTGRTYLERGEPVVVLIRWVTLPPRQPRSSGTGRRGATLPAMS